MRFKSTIEEISPDDAASGSSVAAAKAKALLGNPGEATPEQIRDLSNRLKACPLQERRMNIFSYEAFSLPPSRVGDFLSHSPRLPGAVSCPARPGTLTPRPAPAQMTSTEATPTFTRVHDAQMDYFDIERTWTVVVCQPETPRRQEDPSRLSARPRRAGSRPDLEIFRTWVDRKRALTSCPNVRR